MTSPKNPSQTQEATGQSHHPYLSLRDVTQPQQIGLLLYPEFSMMAVASAIEPLRAANRLAGRSLYQWHLMSRDGGSICSSSGLPLQTISIEEAPLPDRLFVVASLKVENVGDSRVSAYLQRLSVRGIPLGALSNGAFVLAEAGLLGGYRCTLHWESQRQFTEKFPLITVCRELFVRDRDRLTCAGGIAGMDLMLDLVAADYGGQLAADVAEQFLHNRIRGPQEQQRMSIQWRYGVNDSRIVKAIVLMGQNLEQILSVEEIAKRCNISARQLERLWLQHFTVTPQRFYLNLRLAEAKRLLKESTESIASIALRCGFVSASHLSSSYRKTTGMTPGEERRKSDLRQ